MVPSIPVREPESMRTRVPGSGSGESRTIQNGHPAALPALIGATMLRCLLLEVSVAIVRVLMKFRIFSSFSYRGLCRISYD